MSILSEINTILSGMDIPSETGCFSGTPPDEYVVVTPVSDTFVMFADNIPLSETQEARLSLFSKNNYTVVKNRIVKSLLQSGFTVTGRRYIGYEQDTHYHHCVVDVIKNYVYEEV